ncbi:MAG: hypothetical protein H0T76_09120 [Nannocystis sp.]|nr:hypothetical protein [Nannocystis sp.]MBA3546630.1 hypothetical protein [Nannocystis sp.]
MAKPERKPKQDLDQLLCALFDEKQLRQFIATRYGEIAPALSDSMTRADVAHAFVMNAEAHGVIDGEFFDALVSVRERRAAEIDELRGRWPLRWPARRPADSAAPVQSRMIGRADDLKVLVEQLTVQSSRAIAVLGPPGIGKTLLTEEALRQPMVVAKYGPRRYRARLDAANNAHEAIGAIGEALGFSPDAGIEQVIAHTLQEGPTLLILDGADRACDNDRSGIGSLCSSYCDIEGLTLVLSHRGERQPPGPTWELLRLEPLSTERSNELFWKIAGRPPVPLPPVLVDACAGVPLVISLLAHAMGGASPEFLARAWNEKRSKLLKRDGGDTQATNWILAMEASINSERMTSSPKAGRLLRLLATLPNGISERELATISPLWSKTNMAAQVLSDVGLAVFKDRRITMLAPVRAYVEDTYAPPRKDLDDLTTYYHLLVTDYARKIGKTDHREAVARLGPEMANVDECLCRELTTGDRPCQKKAVAAVLLYAKFMLSTGRLRPSPLEAALRCAGEVLKDEHCALHCRMNLGQIKVMTSHPEAAIEQYTDALRSAEKQRLVWEQAECRLQLGRMQGLQGHHTAGNEHLRRAIELFERCHNMEGVELAWRALVGPKPVYDPDDREMDEVLEGARKARNHRLEALALMWIGNAAYDRGMYRRAESEYAKALALYEAIGPAGTQADCTLALAKSQLKQKKYGDARRNADASHAHYCSSGSRAGEAEALCSLASIDKAEDERDRAKTRLERALKIWEELGNPTKIAVIHGQLVWVDSDRRSHHFEKSHKALAVMPKHDLDPYASQILSRSWRVLAAKAPFIGVMALIVAVVVLVVRAL